MGIRKLRDVTGTPIEDFKPGDDVHRTVDALYKYGRRFPNGKPTQKDYSATGIPRLQPKSPSWDSERADYQHPSRVPPMAAPDESQPQFQVDKTADHVDVPVSDWTRGGDCSHPHFDHGKSGDRYRK
jgi:hypothetical protein